MPKSEVRNRRQEPFFSQRRHQYMLVGLLITVGIVIVVCVSIFTHQTDKDTVIKTTYHGDMMIRAFPKSEEDNVFLRNFDQLKLSASVWGLPVNPKVPVYIYIRSGSFHQVEEALQHHHIPFEILFEDLQQLIDEEAHDIAARKAEFTNGTYDFGNYHDYAGLLNVMNTLSKSPLVAIKTLGHTHEHRNITLVTISRNASEEKPVIFINCGIHAREWIAPAVCIYMIHELIGPHVDDVLLDTFDWWIVPLANPDGYAYTWTHDRMWRKNRRPSSSSVGCYGVDLNRNFDAGFASTVHNPCSNSYGGPAPFSEPETRAMRDLLTAHGRRVKATLFMHSFSQLWLSPYGVNTSDPADFEEMKRVMARGVKALHDTHKTEFQFGSIANTLYAASGTAVDYCYVTLGVIYSFLIELRDRGRHGFVLPVKEIIPTATETWNGVREMALAIKEKL